MKPSPVRTLAACLVGWLVPGGGQLLLGRAGRGLVFLGCLLAMFGMGVAMDARLELVAGFEDPLALLRSAAQMAIGLPYLLARLLGDPVGRVTSVVHEYGNTFTEVSGLLNVLVVLDAFDLASGRKK